MKEAREEAERRRREQEERERLHQEWQAQRWEKLEEIRKEEEEHKRLLQYVEAWKQAEDVRAFIAAVEERISRTGKVVVAGSEVDQWIAQARRRADWLDPLIEGPPSVLDEKARWQYPNY